MCALAAYLVNELPKGRIGIFRVFEQNGFVSFPGRSKAGMPLPDGIHFDAGIECMMSGVKPRPHPMGDARRNDEHLPFSYGVGLSLNLPITGAIDHVVKLPSLMRLRSDLEVFRHPLLATVNQLGDLGVLLVMESRKKSFGMGYRLERCGSGHVTATTPIPNPRKGNTALLSEGS